MSRCYPYPPPGYEKKPHVELGLSPKKEKHKHRDKSKDKSKDKDREKRKKRKRDSETNGDSSRRDKDKRSKKSQQPGGIEDGVSLTNGVLSETKSAVSTAAIHDEITTLHRSKTDVSRVEEASGVGMASMHIASEHDRKVGPTLVLISAKAATEPDSKVDAKLPLVLTKAVSNGGTGSMTLTKDVVDLTRTTCQGAEEELGTQLKAQIACIEKEKVWCAIDDQEWLFLCNPTTQKSVVVEQGEAPEAWAEAIYLPSVGIHALPYVVPD